MMLILYRIDQGHKIHIFAYIAQLTQMKIHISDVITKVQTSLSLITSSSFSNFGDS